MFFDFKLLTFNPTLNGEPEEHTPVKRKRSDDIVSYGKRHECRVALIKIYQI
jgi:hypothetical protein